MPGVFNETGPAFESFFTVPDFCRHDVPQDNEMGFLALDLQSRVLYSNQAHGMGDSHVVLRLPPMMDMKSRTTLFSGFYGHLIEDRCHSLCSTTGCSLDIPLLQNELVSFVKRHNMRYNAKAGLFDNAADGIAFTAYLTHEIEQMGLAAVTACLKTPQLITPQMLNLQVQPTAWAIAGDAAQKHQTRKIAFAHFLQQWGWATRFPELAFHEIL